MLTSSQVLNLSSVHGEFPPYNVAAVFLDEFRLMIYSLEYTGNPPEFTLFDTLVSQDPPMNFRRFRLPPKYQDRCPSVTFDTCIALGTLDLDDPLIADPSQAFILLRLSNNGTSSGAFIVLRIQALVEQACLMETDTHIPWRELERDAVVLETSVSNSHFSVQGVHMIEETRCSVSILDFSLCFHVFDLSRRGCSTLRNTDGKTMWATWHEDGRHSPIERSGTVVGDALGSLGNGAFYCLVCGSVVEST